VERNRNGKFLSIISRIPPLKMVRLSDQPIDTQIGDQGS